MKTIIKYELGYKMRHSDLHSTMIHRMSRLMSLSDFSENISVLTAYIYLRIVMRSMSPKIHMSGVRME